MPHYLLRYQYVDGIDAKRGPYRDEHLTRLWAEADAGRVLIAGGAGDPVSEGIIAWSVDDPQLIHEFVKGDPYMTAGLITSYDVVPWRTVVGDAAAEPLRP
ncbi:MAG: YciI family protein [Demequina sp.]|jgi:uncharacterized protein YciI|nr:YciI family protein [Demequina sp.]